MHLWIVTIGSSDVQLISDKANQAKGRAEEQRSDKVWHYWYTDDLRADCNDIFFEPKQGFRDKDESYRIAPRILGRVYQASNASRQEEIWDYLIFPLLDNFVQLLEDYPAPEAIVIFLTDQSAIFQSDRDRQANSPYWQDTWELKLVLQKYFTEKFLDIPCEFISLVPDSKVESLDNWNAVLDLIRSKFIKLTIVNQSIQVDPQQYVYVSHQAGTPAISSAVQFCSLAKFGDRVKFLVSNEQSEKFTDLVESSAYLKGIKREQAKKLLENHDYSGVRDVIGEYLVGDERILLESALLWNYAKFDAFAAELQKLSNQNLVELVKDRSKWWWWTAYESAYLAVVRLEKKDTVDALFHSFRAIEGIFTAWGIQHFHDHIHMKNDRPYLQTSILEEDQYFSRVKYKEKDGKQVPENDIAKLKNNLECLKLKEKDTVFYGLTVYTLFREIRKDWKSKCRHINRFWDVNNGISEKRNKVFHQLKGLTDHELFEIWEVSSPDSWEERILQFANYVSEQDFSFLDKADSGGRVASLMVKVHQELENAISDL